MTENPYQQYYQDPYGQNSREGTVEEHIHRSATRRISDSRTPHVSGTPSSPSSGKTGLILGIAGTAGLAVALVALFMFLSYKGSVTGQLTQMRQALTQAQTAAQRAQAAADSYRTLPKEVTSMGNQLGTLASFSLTCSTDLTGPNGPAQFYFPCSGQKP